MTDHLNIVVSAFEKENMRGHGGVLPNHANEAMEVHWKGIRTLIPVPHFHQIGNSLWAIMYLYLFSCNTKDCNPAAIV